MQISKFGVVLIGLDSAYPHMVRDREIKSPADGHGERSVVTCGKFAHTIRKVAVKAMDATEERLPVRLQKSVSRNTHSESTHTSDQAEPYIEAGDVVGVLSSCLSNGREVAPDRYGELSGAARHPEASAATYRRIGVLFTEHH